MSLKLSNGRISFRHPKLFFFPINLVSDEEDNILYKRKKMRQIYNDFRRLCMHISHMTSNVPISSDLSNLRISHLRKITLQKCE